MSTLRPFSQPGYTGFWAAALVINLANWMQQVGAASLMTTLTPSPTLAALVQTAASLPAVILGLPAGALADLVDRRRWLMSTQLWGLVVAAIAAMVMAAGAMQPVTLLLVTAMLGVGYSLQLPALQATSGQVVPREMMRDALSLSGVAFNIARIAGPALAGLLVTLGGGEAVYGAIIVCAAGVTAYLYRWSGPSKPRSRAPPERLWSALRNGVRFVQHSPDSRRQLRSLLVFLAMGSAPWALLPVVSRDVYHMGTGGYGVMLGALGVGGILGVWLLAYMRGRWQPHRVAALSLLAFSGVSAALAFKLPLWLTLPILSVGGAVWMCGGSSIYAEFQTVLPDWVRARAVSIYNIAYFLAMGLGAAMWGALASPLSVSDTLLVGTAGMAAVALWLWRHPIHAPASGIKDDHPRLSEWASLPEPGDDIQRDEDPVLVRHAYSVRPDAVAQFVRMAEEVGRSCRRNGAEFWRLYRDVENPLQFEERYLVESWAELLRQQDRLTPQDVQLRRALDPFLRPGTQVATTYQVPQQPIVGD